MTASGISLRGSVGVSSAEKLHASILETLQSEGVLHVDCRELQDFDASLLQLLLSAKSQCDSAAAPFELLGLSGTHQSLLSEAGAGDLLTHVAAVTTQDEAESAGEENCSVNDGGDLSDAREEAPKVADEHKQPETQVNEEDTVENS